jgi:5'(3')-deoxyribonucleotidase
MKKKILAIDLDSTLNTLDTEWIQFYNKDFNDNLTREDMIRWEVYTYVKPECGKKIYDYLLYSNFFKNLGMQLNADNVTKWLQQFYDIYIVTAYTPSTCADKCEWVKQHLPHIPVENIIFCNNKGLIKADILIDDGGHNLVAFKETNPHGIPIVFDAPWNRDLQCKAIRVYDWLDIKENIKELLHWEDKYEF